jgi:hypothetical protein
VTASYLSSTVSVLLGTGSGGFGPKTELTAGTQPVSVAIGELNGDGRPDLAVANYGSNTVSVLPNSYPPPPTPRVFARTDFTTANWPFSVAIGDLNGDGKPDLVTANDSTYTVSVLLATGGGAFGPKTDFATGMNPRSVAIGDLNLDGKPDLVVANSNRPTFFSPFTISVMLGTGTGGFGPKTDFMSGVGPAAVAIGDLNADGKPDVAVANDVGSVSVLLGTGTGSFSPKTDFATAANAASVAIGDLNGDGKPDLVTANHGTAGTVSVLLGTGGGSFGAKSDFTVGDQPLAVAIGDLDNDGKPDLAVANFNSATVSVLLGTGGGSFGAKTDYTAGIWPFSVAIGDLDIDGKLDLAVTNFSSNTVSVLLGTGGGSFGPKTDFATGVRPSWVAIGDLDGNGSRDLAVSTQYSNSVSVMLNIFDTAPPTAHVLAPNGGETIGEGTTTNITWTASDNVGVDHVDLFYSLNSGATYTPIASSQPNSGTFSWSVPAIATNHAVRVRVAAFDVTGNNAADESDADFTIEDPTAPLAHVVSPNGGETIGKGSSFDITWTASDNLGVNHVDLYYSHDSGATFTPIASGQPNTGTYSWSVPTIATNDSARVRVVAFDASGNSTADSSDADFTIEDASAPVVHVVSPDGGESLDAGDASKITWTATDNVSVDHVDLYYSLNGGTSYTSIAPGQPNSGTYDWDVPLITTIHTVRVRVAAFDASGNNSTDASDADFTIVDIDAPATPAPFAAVFPGGPVQLHWGANTEPDFAFYRLYRDTSASFVPAPGNLVVSKPDTGYVDAGSTWSYYKLSAVDSSGNESGFATLTPASSFTGATPVGSNVVVPLASNVTLTFQNVTGAGQTSLTMQTGGPIPPDGLKLVPTTPKLYYILSSTATFTGTITVCVTYNPATVTKPENTLKMMHYDTAFIPPKWVAVTTTRDTAANIICGKITHFSEFALMEDEFTVDVGEELPTTFQRISCAPNPVSGPAQIWFDLSVASPVRLGLFDLQGRRVRDLERQPMMSPGRHIVQWDGLGEHGEHVPAGIYFLRLEAGGIHQLRRVAVME